jgi:hypothetical protein
MVRALIAKRTRTTARTLREEIQLGASSSNKAKSETMLHTIVAIAKE